jgi:serine-type D-Ala-D-Ala carboxypeptidase (penicillin-binding protein 5/6)
MNTVSRLRFDQYLSMLLFMMALVLLPSLGGAQAQQVSQAEGQKKFPELKKHLLVPMRSFFDEDSESIPAASASAMYVMDAASGSILFEKNSSSARYPASTAKMMTALVARKTFDLDKVITVRQEAFTTGTTAKLPLGEQFTVKELLHALLIPSGNDAAFVLANNHPIGYSGFVNDMNVLAEELHLDDTHFGNPSGLDAQKQTATARDLAILAKELMKDDTLREIVGIKNYVLRDVTGQQQHPVQNTQELLGTVEGVVGIKTGTTQFAGENLITEVDRDGHQIIIVVLGSQDRYNETKNIIDWVFSSYEWREVGR